jgi:hemerythrin-like domain-containing protein
MSDPVVLLKTDHREAEALLKTLANSKPGARRQATLKKLTDALSLHMRIEEDEIYPFVAKRVGEEDAEEANIEHGLARDGLTKLHELVSEPGFGAAVAMLTAGIKHHVKEEEREMFPELKRNLDREELADIGDRVVQAKKQSRTSEGARAAGCDASTSSPRSR